MRRMVKELAEFAALVWIMAGLLVCGVLAILHLEWVVLKTYWMDR